MYMREQHLKAWAFPTLLETREGAWKILALSPREGTKPADILISDFSLFRL